MPDPNLSQAIKEAYAAAPSNVTLFQTIELRHPSFTQPLRLVNDHNDLIATLESSAPANPGEQVTFQAFAWQMVLPGIEDAATPEITITIDGVTREVVDQLELAQQSQEIIRLTWRPYLSTDKSAPAMNPPLHMTLTNVSADAMRVTIRANFGDLVNQAFPSEDYTATRFPGLVR